MATRNSYIIPKNFIDESKIIKGLFRTRYFIEGIAFGLIGLIIGFLIPANSLATRLTIVSFCFFPIFFLGTQGVDGGPLSVYLSNILYWRRHKKIMFYDSNPRVLKESPLENMMNQTDLATKVSEYVEDFKAKRLEKKLDHEFIEGENFLFAEDRDYTRNYIDPTKPQGTFKADDYDLIFDKDFQNYQVVFDDMDIAAGPVIHSDDLDDTFENIDYLNAAPIIIDDDDYPSEFVFLDDTWPSEEPMEEEEIVFDEDDEKEEESIDAGDDTEEFTLD